MQQAYKRDYKTRETEVISSTTREMKTSRVRSIQIERGQDPCFMTSKRLTCKDQQCEWRSECCRLVAVWKR